LYRSNLKFTAAQLIEPLKQSTVDERTPVNGPDRIRKMLAHRKLPKIGMEQFKHCFIVQRKI
jgi:hypothetical protein